MAGMETMIPPATELLLAWDAQRPRSLQADLGISALGGCRRRAGYTLAGVAPDSPASSVQAVLGTAVHEVLAQVLRSQVDDNAIVDDGEVWFAGLRGHPDLYVPPNLRDFKSVGYTAQLTRIRSHGPPRQHRWQAHVYAAALIVSGRPVEVVEIDYIARDSGDGYLWREPFDLEAVREAMTWLHMVRSADTDVLARDYAPDSAYCGNCPFRARCWEGGVPGRDPRTVLYAEDPDAARWAQRLEDARARKAQAEEDEKLAKGALDALRPNTEGSVDVAVAGMAQRLRFTITAGRRSADLETIRADYARAGAEVPMVRGEPGVRVSLVAPED